MLYWSPAEGVAVTDDVAGQYRARVGPLTIGRYALGVAYVLITVVNFRDGDHSRAAWAWAGMSLFWFGSAVLLGRARTIVDTEGVHTRGVRRWRHTPWDLVNFTTSAPSTYLRPADLTLRTVDGKEIATQVPALRWEAVKAYGEAHRTDVDARPADRPPSPS